MHRNHSLAALALAGALLAAGCQNMMRPEPTPLELQAMQSRDFDHDKQAVFSSVMSVFQDMGYTATSADLETGFIAAETAVGGGFDLFDLLVEGGSVVQTRATAYIERRGKSTRARFSFVEVLRSTDDDGRTTDDDRRVLDPEVYANAFERVEQALFMRSN